MLAVALVAAACGWGVYLTGSPWALLPLALPFVRVPWGDEDGEGGTLPEDADRKRREVELALGPRTRPAPRSTAGTRRGAPDPRSPTRYGCTVIPVAGSSSRRRIPRDGVPGRVGLRA